MISRSGGESFHLLLADRPLPYPIEKASSPPKKISICFCYAHVRQPNRTLSCIVTCIVIVPGPRTNHPALVRQIELIVDLLTERPAGEGQLDERYEFIESDSVAVA